jgi:hypothetical protein
MPSHLRVSLYSQYDLFKNSHKDGGGMFITPVWEI